IAQKGDREVLRASSNRDLHSHPRRQVRPRIVPGVRKAVKFTRRVSASSAPGESKQKDVRLSRHPRGRSVRRENRGEQTNSSDERDARSPPALTNTDR